MFEAEAKKIGGAQFLAQGTLYPDVIESVSFTGGPSVTIKSHHNVGGLPARMNMKLVEPLRELFKDEVRELGRELGLPPDLVNRHPFPGPGLAIRIPGDITKEKLDLLRQVDAVYLDEIRKAGLYDEIWQAFAVLLPVRTVGVMGDGRTYDQACALRAVTSTDGMTADYYPFDHAFLGRVADAHHQRGAGDQPGDVRHHEQAAGDDRVGVIGPLMPARPKYEYDLVFSFAGEEQGNSFERLYKLLTDEGMGLLRQSRASVVVGQGLYQHLQDIYRDRARYCVVFASEHYLKKRWDAARVETSPGARI